MHDLCIPSYRFHHASIFPYLTDDAKLFLGLGYTHRMDILTELATTGDGMTIPSAIEIRKLVLGGARGTFVLKDGWDDPLTDAEMQDLFGL